MKQETLFESNPYLYGNSSYADQLVANVTSSTAIELGTVKASLKRALIKITQKRPVKTSAEK
ncbi:MAG: hypothetical protein HQL22_09695 [Candidatus Omnitrophica bacterium]|nr:hypothetical protein [Candidatus Omnitrophota bacterium]